MNDWTGNKASARAIIGINKNYNTKDRETNDYYASDPLAMQLLLEKETFSHSVWEPACGEGHLSKVLVEHGYDVKSTDLVDRGYGIGNTDFFLQNEPFGGDIITNPPYKYAMEFVLHALELIPIGNKVAMFLKITFLEGTKRYQCLYKTQQLKTIYVATKRLRCSKNGRFDLNEQPMMTYAWYVWQKGYKDKPVIEWINTPEEEKGDLFDEPYKCLKTHI